jgi:hypothetical protein
MRQLKYYACQIAKVLTGSVVISIIIGIVTLLVLIVIANLEAIEAIAYGITALFLILLAFEIGDTIFKEYNICKRFK